MGDAHLHGKRGRTRSHCPAWALGQYPIPLPFTPHVSPEETGKEGGWVKEKGGRKEKKGGGRRGHSEFLIEKMKRAKKNLGAVEGHRMVMGKNLSNLMTVLNGAETAEK